MLVTENALHLGPELARAVNRIDFFRLFKSLTDSHGFSHFGVAELAAEDQGIDFKHTHALHNFPVSWFCDPSSLVLGADDPVVQYLQRSSAPGVLNLEQTPSEVLTPSGSAIAAIVPLHGASGKRHGLVMVGDAPEVEHQSLASIALDAALIFQRYFEVILSLDSISGLSDRELQIVSLDVGGKDVGGDRHHPRAVRAHGQLLHRRVLRKLHVVNRAQMVASAIRSGLIT
jgi:LuxR family transcriptional regulator